MNVFPLPSCRIVYRYKDTMTGRWWEERSAHHPRDAEASLRSWNKCLQAPPSKGQVSGANTGAHKPHNTECVPGKPRQVRTSPTTQRVSPGPRAAHTRGHDTEGSAQAPTYKFLPAAQGGTRKEALAMIPRASRVLAALRIRWEGHSEAEVDIDAPNTPKARTTAERHTKPMDTPKSTTGRCTALQRDEIQLHQPEQTQAPPTRKTSQDTKPTPSTGVDSTAKATTLRTFVKFFSFSLIYHAVYSPNISPPSH